MPQDILGRVRCLIELAVAPSANEHEARNSALQACRLIKEHGLLKQPSTPAKAPVAYAVTLDEDFIDSVFRNYTRTSRKDHSPGAVYPPSDEQPRKPDPNMNYIIIAFPARCGICRTTLPLGKNAVWSRGDYFHPTCYEATT
jgi:hypothetical protein